MKTPLYLFEKTTILQIEGLKMLIVIELGHLLFFSKPLFFTNKWRQKTNLLFDLCFFVKNSGF